VGTALATLARYRREVYTAGDGFFAAFDGSARAVRCGGTVEGGEAVKPLGIEVSGRCAHGRGRNDRRQGGWARREHRSEGSTAGASEVLVSQTVKDLVAGSGLEFEVAGEHVLKGIPERWRLFRVARVM